MYCICRRFALFVALALCLGSAPRAQALQPEPAPKDLSTPGSWTMVVLPDVQSYVDHAANTHILNEMMHWIADSTQALNVQLVLQEGDIVFQNGIQSAKEGSGDQNSRQQWDNARNAFAILDGVVPYIVVPGNHDYGVTCAENRQTRFNDYFTPAGNPLVDPAQHGILVEMGPNASGVPTLENAAYVLTAPDSRQLLLFGLEWSPRQAVVDWAKGVANREEYRGYTKLLITHAYLYSDGTRYDWAAKGAGQNYSPHSYAGTSSDANDGEELWNELVRSTPKFELVFCGHIAEDMVDYLKSQNDFGESVHQLVFNAQFLPHGGEGWLRLLEFLPDGKTVHVRTYSPHFAADGDPATSPWRMTAVDDFSFVITPLAMK